MTALLMAQQPLWVGIVKFGWLTGQRAHVRCLQAQLLQVGYHNIGRAALVLAGLQFEIENSFGQLG